jgi:hypothetical protein
METCETCRYYANAERLCRRRAPAAGEHVGRIYPRVRLTDWCGEHESAAAHQASQVRCGRCSKLAGQCLCRDIQGPRDKGTEGSVSGPAAAGLEGKSGAEMLDGVRIPVKTPETADEMHARYLMELLRRQHAWSLRPTGPYEKTDIYARTRKLLEHNERVEAMLAFIKREPPLAGDVGGVDTEASPSPSEPSPPAQATTPSPQPSPPKEEGADSGPEFTLTIDTMDENGRIIETWKSRSSLAASEEHHVWAMRTGLRKARELMGAQSGISVAFTPILPRDSAAGRGPECPHKCAYCGAGYGTAAERDGHHDHCLKRVDVAPSPSPQPSPLNEAAAERISVEEARERGVCRICGLGHPHPDMYGMGTDFAHVQCLHGLAVGGGLGIVSVVAGAGP